MKIGLIQILTTFLFLIPVFQSWSQGEGEIRFGVDLEGELRIDKRYFEIQLPDTLLINQSSIKLPVGNYTGEVWAPGFNKEQISFEIFDNERTDLMVYLKHSDEFHSYQKDLPGYIKKGKQLRRTPLILTSLFAIGTVFSVERMTNFERKIYQGVDRYPKTTSVLNMYHLKNELYFNSNKYNSYRIWFYTGTALTGASVVATIIGARYFKKKIIRPSYNKVSPFQNQLVLGLGPNGINLTWNI
ncbi:MAG: hypothetical protein GQ574_03840 [Crocinitomix sp.]|nr:hypothetical protein [Crocinitomix sp.]